MSRSALMPTLILAAVLALSSAARAQSVTGDWLSPGGEAKVRISPCGDSVCGSFVWLKDGTDAKTGQPDVDERNPDPALRHRPILGLTFLFGFRRGPDGRWTHGRIYDPNSGHTWGSKLIPLADGRLKLEGCLGPICKGQVWEPAIREASRN